jgi:hypothetical protein
VILSLSNEQKKQTDRGDSPRGNEADVQLSSSPVNDFTAIVSHD